MYTKTEVMSETRRLTLHLAKLNALPSHRHDARSRKLQRRIYTALGSYTLMLASWMYVQKK